MQMDGWLAAWLAAGRPSPGWLADWLALPGSGWLARTGPLALAG